MCDSQRQLAVAEHVDENARVTLTRENKVDLFLHASRATFEIIADCLLEVGKAGAGVVEVRYGLVERAAWIVREQALESAESLCGVEECFRVVNGLAGVRAGDEIVASPAFAVLCSEIGLAVLCEEHPEAFALRVAAALDNYVAQVSRDSDDILHQLVWILENIRIYQLNKVACAAAVSVFEIENKSVVYMTVV